MTRLPFLLLLAMPACLPLSVGDDDDCVDPTATLCATMNGEPDADATLLFDADLDEEEPISSPADGTGCATFDVVETSYLVQATNEQQNCASEWTVLEPATCGDTRLTIELINGCMDGG